MPADGPHARPRPRPVPTGLRPPERAQLVWRRAVDLSTHGGGRDRFELARALLRTAHNDPATMAHASAIGRRRVRADANDTAAQGGLCILDAAIAFLGAKPHAATG